jgi:hypothetical protein
MPICKFDVTYGTHSYEEPWELTALFCLSCGHSAIWCKRDGGDYYQGETYLCIDCEASWALPSEPDRNVDEIKTQRLTALRFNKAGKG